MKVIVISGPTASGKTDLAIELAQRHQGEVVNFDSLLLYQEINIGTAKPSLSERASVPHHMIDVSSISSPMNAADYSRKALPIIEEILGRGKIVFLVGGSGFYLQALLKGMYESTTTPIEITERSNKLYEDQGITPFLDFLQLNDPESLNRYHVNDHYRLRRAVEHFWATGTPLSSARVKKDSSNQELQRSSIHDWDIFHIHLDLPKDEHLKIIETRTDKMLKSGLLEEVDGLISSGFSGNEKPLQSIGYKEVLDYRKGIFSDLNECRERIIISTRQLAKSQRTWFKRDHQKEIFHPLIDRVKINLSVDEFIGK